MKTKMKSFQTPSNKPVDVEYRLRRTFESLDAALTFATSVSPDALPGDTHQRLVGILAAAVKKTSEAYKARPAKKAKKTKVVEAPVEELPAEEETPAEDAA